MADQDPFLSDAQDGPYPYNATRYTVVSSSTPFRITNTSGVDRSDPNMSWIYYKMGPAAKTPEKKQEPKELEDDRFLIPPVELRRTRAINLDDD